MKQKQIQILSCFISKSKKKNQEQISSWRKSTKVQVSVKREDNRRPYFSDSAWSTNSKKGKKLKDSDLEFLGFLVNGRESEANLINARPGRTGRHDWRRKLLQQSRRHCFHSLSLLFCFSLLWESVLEMDVGGGEI